MHKEQLLQIVKRAKKKPVSFCIDGAEFLADENLAQSLKYVEDILGKNGLSNVTICLCVAKEFLADNEPLWSAVPIIEIGQIDEVFISELVSKTCGSSLVSFDQGLIPAILNSVIFQKREGVRVLYCVLLSARMLSSIT